MILSICDSEVTKHEKNTAVFMIQQPDPVMGNSACGRGFGAS